MYSIEALYEILGWAIIVLLILSAIALIVCMRDRIKWKREQENYYTVASSNHEHTFRVKGRKAAGELWEQLSQLYPGTLFYIRKD